MSKTCKMCNIEKEDEEFYKKKDGYKGLASYCKPCYREYGKAHYSRNSDKYRPMYSKKQEEYKAINIEYITNYKLAHGCTYCDEKDICCYDFHHLRDKSFNISQKLVRSTLQRIIEEIEKCVVVCSNCHRKLHAGRTMIPRIRNEELECPKRESNPQNPAS